MAIKKIYRVYTISVMNYINRVWNRNDDANNEKLYPFEFCDVGGDVPSFSEKKFIAMKFREGK